MNAQVKPTDQFQVYQLDGTPVVVSRPEFEAVRDHCLSTICTPETSHYADCRWLPKKIPSASARRTVMNNIMRHNYRKLSDAEAAQMDEIKDMGLAFWELLLRVGAPKDTADSDVNPLRLASRELSIAATKIEEAVMWAVKHVTR